MNYKAPTKAIITDAGFASRFLPITKTVPKAMIPIGAKPIMQLCVEECAEAGIAEVIIVATPGTMGKAIYEDYFLNRAEHIKVLLEQQGKDERFKPVEAVLNLPKITVIEQDPNLPYGTASPIISARQFLAHDEAFLTLQSDDIVIGASDAKTLVKAFAEHPDAKSIMMAQEVPHEVVNKYGIIVTKNGDLLDYIVEKPSVNEAPSNLASYGRFLQTPEVFEYFDELGKDEELWQVDGVTKLAKTGKVYVVPTKGRWYTTGDPKNYLAAQVAYDEFSTGRTD
jgi:UTP--glucose-1-phosphate uridylyltransferase